MRRHSGRDSSSTVFMFSLKFVRLATQRQRREADGFLLYDNRNVVELSTV